MNSIDEILRECAQRKKADPVKTAAEIVAEVMDEAAAFKAELRKRPEFAGLSEKE